MKKLLLGLCLALSVVHICNAQKAPAKFGDIPIEDLKLTNYDKDSSASAVVLVDFGHSYLRYNQEKGFQLFFERIRRIKILTKEGLDMGSQNIKTYHSSTSNDTEKLTSLKAVTYNLENGKIVESKMKSDAIFKEKYDKNWDITNFALPNVKVGSVIEYTYTILSDFFVNFQDWEFQSSVPTVWSEYRASIPEYFNYDKYTQGYVPFHVNEQKAEAGSITLSYKDRSEGRVTQTTFQNEKLDFKEYKFRWVAKDVPAFKPEPFLTTPDDYISKINFELASVAFPEQPMKKVMGSWQDINKLYHESDDFGREVKGNAFLKKIVDDVTSGMTTNEQKIEAIVRYVKSTVSWDGSSRSFSSSVLRQVLENKKGNSAEINLILASMLEKAGLDVHPVLISTRDHGFIREMYPASTQFNYAICHVKYDNKELLLDATEPFLPTNTLPERCLNGRGLLINSSGGAWVNLTSGIKTKTSARAILKLSDNGTMTGDLVIERTGYEALKQRKNYSAKGEADYVKELVGSKDWTLHTSSFENVKDTKAVLKETHNLDIANHTTVAGDVIYLNPFVVLHNASNPFKLEQRQYPVDFGFAKDEVYILSLTIPDGYAIEELPASKVVALPNNAAKYLYNISVTGTTIQFTSSFSLNKSLFDQLEYPNIREYFNQVVAKQAEQIVLKRKI